MRISGSNPEGMAVALSPGKWGRAVCVLTITMTTPGSSKLVHEPPPDPARSRVWSLRQGLLGQAGGHGQRMRHAGVGAADGKWGAP